jgi:hypothetical protein
MAFVVLSGLVVGALVLGLVVLNVLVAQASFRFNDLQEAVQREEVRSQQLRYAVATADSPEAIAEAAATLGLVAPERQDFIVRSAGDAGDPAGSGGPTARGDAREKDIQKDMEKDIQKDMEKDIQKDMEKEIQEKGTPQKGTQEKDAE